MTPALTQLRPGLWMLGMPMPGDRTTPSWSLCYLFVSPSGDLHVVDPGSSSDQNRALLSNALDTLGGLDHVESVTVTHLHRDHLGLAPWLTAASGAALVLHCVEQRAVDAGTHDDIGHRLVDWGVPADRGDELRAAVGERGGAERTVRADRLLADGEELGIPGFELVAMWTPGHTVGHVCLRDNGLGVVLTGDTLLPTQHPGIGLGGAAETNPLADYLSSLSRLSAYDSLEVLPGHGMPFRGLAARATQSAEHQLRRSDEVRTVLAAEPGTTTWRIATQLTWTAGWQNLAGFYLLSALHQTAIHRDYLERS